MNSYLHESIRIRTQSNQIILILQDLADSRRFYNILVLTASAARVINAALAVFTGLFCIFHMAELVSEFNPVQLTILPVMAVVGVLLAVDSIKAARK